MIRNKKPDEFLVTPGFQLKNFIVDLAVHRNQEFLVGLCKPHSVLQKFHGFDGVHVGQVVTKNPDTLEYFAL